MTSSPFLSPGATLYARRVAADANTVESRKRRLANTLADLGLPRDATDVLRGEDPDVVLFVVRRVLRQRLTAANATGSNADVAAYRTALDEVGALWAVL